VSPQSFGIPIATLKGMATDNKQKSGPEAGKKSPRPTPVPKKIGEPPSNLQSREHWFRKRAGN
jgi:hypothetical protein